MTTQQPTQPEATQDPVIMRVGRLEGIAEEIHHRLAENHAEHQTLRAETLALSEKVDRQVESLRAEIRALNAKMDRQTYWILGAFVTVWATTVGAVVALFLAM